MRQEILQPGTYASIPKQMLAVASKKLSPAAKLVWMSIVDRFGDNDFSWPGAGQIAGDTGLSRRGAQEAIDQLARLKLLTIIPPDQQFKSNRYRLTQFASALSSLVGNDPDTSVTLTDMSEQVAHGVRHPSALSSPPPSAQSSLGVAHSVRPNYLINHPSVTTEETTQLFAAAPLDGACAPSVTASPVTKRKKRAEKLTPEEVQSLSAFQVMERFLLFGRDGIHREDTTGLTPALSNWRIVTSNSEDPESKVAKWEAQHFAAYYWWLVCRYNHEHGIPCALPKAGLGRIAKALESMLWARTNNQVLARLFNLYQFMDLIKIELANFRKVEFNERTLSDDFVWRVITHIEQQPGEEVTARCIKAGVTVSLPSGRAAA